MFQDIVYFRYGNKNIMISKNIGVPLAHLAPLHRRPMIKQKNCKKIKSVRRKKNKKKENIENGIIIIFLVILEAR